MSKCLLQYKSIEEIKNAVETSTTTREALNKLGYSISKNTNVCKTTKAILIDICKQHNIRYEHLLRKNYKKKQDMFCSMCGIKLCKINQTGLCAQCYAKKRNQEKIKKWLETGDTGCNVLTTIRGVIREYIYEQQNYKCAICGMQNIWHGKQLVFVLDHIDGNAANNRRENLRLICPNCDSQLPTFKSKNKHSARTFRSTKDSHT